MSDNLNDGAEDERMLELSAIEAIYPELSRNPADPFSAYIDVLVEPYEPVALQLRASDKGAPLIDLHTAIEALNISEDRKKSIPDELIRSAVRDGTTSEGIHFLLYLPPLKLTISLPNGYPTEKAPVFEIQSSWLPETKVQELEKRGAGMWEELGRELVVFAYLDFLRDAADDFFGFRSEKKVMHEVHAEREAFLLDFDLKTKRAKFEEETFECGVCLEPKKGAVCHRLSLCSHVFCVDCLQNFYNSCITEGDVGSVKCMAVGCGNDSRSLGNGSNTSSHKKKKRRTLKPSELLEIPLEQEIVQRYIKLKRKKRLESDRSVIYCPRQWCQGPARSKKTASIDADSDTDTDTETSSAPPQRYDPNEPSTLPPPAERLAICEDCTFAFCKVCKASWHGEYYTCFPRSQFEITAEERASEDYMKLHTQPCPTCDAHAQKTHGCNHMICFKCNTHFCYLCGAYLQKENPYAHFNTKNNGCYMRLWELEAGDGDEIGHAFAGGVAAILENEDEGNDEEGMIEAIPEPPPQQQMAPVVPILEIPAAAAAAGGAGGVPRREPGLQRFLAMVQDDEEDEWDSDEMEDVVEGFE